MRGPAIAVGGFVAVLTVGLSVLAVRRDRETRARAEALRRANEAAAAGARPSVPGGSSALISGPLLPADLAWAETLAAELDGADPAKAARIAVQLTERDHRLAVGALRKRWEQLKPDARAAILTAVETCRSPFRLDVVAIGMTDSDPGVLALATRLFLPWAFRDFTNDPEGWESWFGRLGGLPADQIREYSAAEYVAALSGTDDADLAATLPGIRRFADRDGAALLKKKGLLDLFRVWLSRGNAEVIDAILSLLPLFGPEMVLAKQVLIPLLATKPASAPLIVAVLGEWKAHWAVPHIAPYLQSTDDATMQAAAEALAKIGGDPAILAMIEAVEQDRSGRAAPIVGRHGLSPVSGIAWDAGHDARFWQSWWEELRRSRPNTRPVRPR